MDLTLTPELLAPAAPDAVPDNRGANLFDADPRCAELLGLYLAPDLHAHLLPHLRRLGALAGDALDRLAGTADKSPPVLHYRDRGGFDREWLEKHPAYVEMERLAYSEFGLAAMSHRAGVLGWPEPLPPIAKFALTYVFVQAEFGLCCPLSMTDSLTRTLRRFGAPELLARYLPGLTSTDMDQLIQGSMFITEQGAGSDVGAVTTIARADGNAWRLYGDKWFCSNADAGLALVLARPEGGAPGTRGLGLFLLPRVLPDGNANRYRIIRLKDKLGSRDMASGEIRMEGATAYLVGELGRGFSQMTDMINSSRLSNGVRAAGMMRRALTDALHLARNRRAFGRRLIDLPLMRRQLLKLMLPAEQARSVFMLTATELARADQGDEQARRRVRILTPLIKFRACRDARRATGDAMEMRGGCGYIEEWSDPRLVRDAHLGSIWEGTSNIVALDVMRAIRREQSLDALQADLDARLQRAGALRGRLAAALERSVSLARFAATNKDDALARQAASAMYRVTAAVAMAEEASRLERDARRALLASLVLEHHLESRDPLMQADTAREAKVALALLDEQPLGPAAVDRLIAH
jgi:alkylation response protein AidB-like acyl-CoA dehydrogenase